jgi:putative ATPase
LLADKAVQLLSEQYKIPVELAETETLFRISGGDARKLYNALELYAEQHAKGTRKLIITNENLNRTVQENLPMYDKQGEMHYDIISAFIKSIRGSDPNAAVYWLARMVEAGEAPEFIARRMLILASEDIGNANPNALLLANTCFDAVHKIGWPESRIILSQTAIYLATSPKSNAAYKAINQAQSAVRKTGNLSVPLHLRNAPTGLMKELGYGENYRYAHDYEGNFTDQEFLPEKLSGTVFYDPGNNPREQEMRKSLKNKWKNRYRY